jgi:hypothetical protein
VNSIHKQLEGFLVWPFLALLLKDGEEVRCWDESLASVRLHTAIRCTAKENNAGAFAFRHMYAEGVLEDKGSRWIVAYAYRGRFCFVCDGIDVPAGSILHAADDVTSRWSPLAHERESGRWIVQEPFPELFPLLFPELFPVGFVSREIQQMSTKLTYAIAASSGTEGRSEMIQ